MFARRQQAGAILGIEGADIMDELLKDYPVVAECKVSWSDMDAFQHVNNVIYFRYVENARIEYGMKIGIMDKMATEGLGPILKWTDCKFIRPVTFPDTLRVGARTLSIEGPEMKMGYLLVSEAQRAVVAAAHSIGVFYDYRNRRRTEETPAELIAEIEKLEGRAVPRKHEE